MAKRKRAVRGPKPDTLQVGGLKLYSLAAVSDQLAISTVTLRRYVKAGRLGAMLLGGKYYISDLQLRAFLGIHKQ